MTHTSAEHGRPAKYREASTAVREAARKLHKKWCVSDRCHGVTQSDVEIARRQLSWGPHPMHPECRCADCRSARLNLRAVERSHREQRRKRKAAG